METSPHSSHCWEADWLHMKHCSSILHPVLDTGHLTLLWPYKVSPCHLVTQICELTQLLLCTCTAVHSHRPNIGEGLSPAQPSKLCNVYSALYTVYSTQYTMYSTLYTVFSTLDIWSCNLHIVSLTLVSIVSKMPFFMRQHNSLICLNVIWF